MIIMNLSVPLRLTTSTARSNVFDLCEHSYPSLHLYLTMLFISDFKSVLLRGKFSWSRSQEVRVQEGKFGGFVRGKQS